MPSHRSKPERERALQSLDLSLPKMEVYILPVEAVRRRMVVSYRACKNVGYTTFRPNISISLFAIETNKVSRMMHFDIYSVEKGPIFAKTLSVLWVTNSPLRKVKTRCGLMSLTPVNAGLQKANHAAQSRSRINLIRKHRFLSNKRRDAPFLMLYLFQ